MSWLITPQIKSSNGLRWDDIPENLRWTPANITTALWLDAADASTITLNTSTVSGWNDKSGNSRHFAQATSANQPVYTTSALSGKNVVTFVSNDSLTRAAIPFNDLGNNSLYIVANKTGSFPTLNVCVLLSRAASRTRTITTNSAINRWGTYIGDQFNSPLGNIDAAYKVSELIADQATNTYLFYQDGTSQGSAGIVNATSVFSDNNCYIGNDQYNSWFPGNIAEIIFCDVKNTDADRQSIEGYLAHKWGLTANLPGDHPYKVNAPTP